MYLLVSSIVFHPVSLILSIPYSRASHMCIYLSLSPASSSCLSSLSSITSHPCSQSSSMPLTSCLSRASSHTLSIVHLLILKIIPALILTACLHASACAFHPCPFIQPLFSKNSKIMPALFLALLCFSCIQSVIHLILSSLATQSCICSSFLLSCSLSIPFMPLSLVSLVSCISSLLSCPYHAFHISTIQPFLPVILTACSCFYLCA